MRHLFLINPVAGKGIRPTETAEEIQQLMKNRPDSYEIRVTEYKGHAEELTRRAAEESGEPLRVYAFGGDGSLNEVVNGGAGYDHVAVTVLPRGSGNDFLKLFTTGGERFRYLHNLIDGKTAPFDLIECNGRLAMNIASVGLDARVGVGMTQFKHLPLVSGSMAYVLSLVANVVRGIGQHYQVELDGQRMEGDYTLLAVCNGRWYGGGFCPVPDAMPDDGLLDFVLVKQVSRMKVAQLVSQYAQGRGRHYPGLIRMSRGHRLTVTCEEEMIAQLDGEELRGNSLSFALSAKKINFLYPDGTGWTPVPM